MLHFPCPKCGGKVETAESDSVSYAARNMKRFGSGSLTGHSHPLFSGLSLALSVGNFIYQRVPGGGAKKCTSCGHHFN